jgi:galactitol-specific phosphotransferase system IIC component
MEYQMTRHGYMPRGQLFLVISLMLNVKSVMQNTTVYNLWLRIFPAQLMDSYTRNSYFFGILRTITTITKDHIQN